VGQNAGAGLAAMVTSPTTGRDLTRTATCHLERQEDEAVATEGAPVIHGLIFEWAVVLQVMRFLRSL
jgi:hypothetical protein